MMATVYVADINRENAVYIYDSIIQAGLATTRRGIHIQSEGQALVQGLRNEPDWTHLGYK